MHFFCPFTTGKFAFAPRYSVKLIGSPIGNFAAPLAVLVDKPVCAPALGSFCDVTAPVGGGWGSPPPRLFPPFRRGQATSERHGPRRSWRP